MSDRRKITYNLPGVGNINAFLFPYSERVWDFLEYYGHISHLKEINQLGALRLVFNGAHHNRYEYLITQLAIITELCKFKGPQDQKFSLGSEIDDFGNINSLDKAPTKGEVLQIYAILSNIGHLPGTFSSERALLSFLKSNNDLKRVFKYGLPSEDYEEFEKVIEDFSIYKFNTFIASFLLGRYRRREGGDEIVSLCRNIIRSFNNHKEQDERVKRMWRLYKALRRFVYLALDSLYAPVPFSIDISSLILSIDQHLEDIFYHESSFQSALGRIEEVMRESVYLSSKSLLQLSKTSKGVYGQLEDNREKFNSRSGLKKLLSGSPLHENCFSNKEELEAVFKNDKCILNCSYQFDRGISTQIIQDTFEWENNIRSRIGRSYSRVGMEWDPSQGYLKISSSVNSEKKFKTKKRAAYNISQQLLKFDLEIVEKSGLGPRERWLNHESILKYLSRATFGWDYKYQLRTQPITEHVYPTIIDYGSTKSSKRLKKYIGEVGGSIYPKDELNELKMIRRTLNNIDYRGLLIAFHDALVITNQERELVEFDGIIYLLGNHQNSVSTIIVEGKNMPNGHTEAKNHLIDKFGELNIQEYQLIDLPTKGAYATLKM